MSELNLVEILKDCPKGTKFYSPLYGDIFFSRIAEDYYAKPVRFFSTLSVEEAFYPNGKKEDCYPDAEIMVFPSKENRDWSTFKVEKPKFDVSPLQPFDKVLVRIKISGESIIRKDVGRTRNKIFIVMKKEEGITPFEFKDGEYYSIEDEEQNVVGIFISDGRLLNYPNGNIDGNIGYLFHAGLFAEATIFNPIRLAGPVIDNNRGFYYPRNFYVRYANDKERTALDEKLRARGYKWDSDKKEIKKRKKKRKKKNYA